MTKLFQSHTPDRLRRAWQLVKVGGVRQVGPQQFCVIGQDEPAYNVDLSADMQCYCKDKYFASPEHQCKHILGARIAIQDPTLLNTLIEMIEFLSEDAA